MVASLDRLLAGGNAGQAAGAMRYVAAVTALVIALPLLGGVLLGHLDTIAAQMAALLATWGRL
jgi:hypothetical protein